ncbi:MAG: hypothetical protein HY904_19170 [Deltaproteobacteria bacterium]|nr:hypothetical protein [Deltaproteobacteria bacterium]
MAAEGMRSVLAVIAAAALAVGGAASCRKDGKGLPRRGVVVLRAEAGEGAFATVKGTRLPVARALTPDEGERAAVEEALASPSGKDAVLLLDRARDVVLHAGKESVGPAALATAGAPAAVVLGAPETPWARGLAVRDEKGGLTAYPELAWTSLPAADTSQEDGALEQALPGRVARLALGMVIQRALDRTGPDARSTLTGYPWLTMDPLTALLEGFDLHAQVLARRQSVSGKLSATVTVENARSAVDLRAAAVVHRRYDWRPAEPTEPLRTPEARAEFLRAWATGKPPAKGTPWNGTQAVGVPGVVAAALLLAGDDPLVAGGVPPGEFFPPFYAGTLPAGFEPGRLGGPVLFRLKLLKAALGRLNLADAPAYPGINHLLDAYAAEFPTERPAVQRALLQATQARTATMQGTQGVDGAAMAMRVTDEVLSGSRYPDGAVGVTVMVRLPQVAVPLPDGRTVALAFNLNGAMAWQLMLLPGLIAQDAERLQARLDKAPVERLQDLAGQIPAETYTALSGGKP